MNLTITNKLLVEEGKRHGIKHEIVSKKHNLILLKSKKRRALIRRSRISATSGVFSYIADQKGATYDVLDFYGFSYPYSQTVADFREARVFCKKIGFPAVVKPEAGAYGNGVTIDIRNFDELKKAFLVAQKFNKREIIVQKFIPGEDYRILIVGFKFVAAARRIPAQIIGDGKSNIRELIKKTNCDSRRGEGHTTPLTKIKIDAEVKLILEKQQLNLNSMPKRGVEVWLRQNANLSTGGEAIDVSDQIPKENKKLLEKIAFSLDANVVGIDVRTKNISKIWKSKDYAVIEVNASPGIRMHHFPSQGKSRNVAKAILKEIFPEVFQKNVN